MTKILSEINYQILDKWGAICLASAMLQKTLNRDLLTGDALEIAILEHALKLASQDNPSEEIKELQKVSVNGHVSWSVRDGALSIQYENLTEAQVKAVADAYNGHYNTGLVPVLNEDGLSSAAGSKKGFVLRFPLEVFCTKVLPNIAGEVRAKNSGEVAREFKVTLPTPGESRNGTEEKKEDVQETAPETSYQSVSSGSITTNKSVLSLYQSGASFYQPEEERRANKLSEAQKSAACLFLVDVLTRREKSTKGIQESEIVRALASQRLSLLEETRPTFKEDFINALKSLLSDADESLILYASGQADGVLRLALEQANLATFFPHCNLMIKFQGQSPLSPSGSFVVDDEPGMPAHDFVTHHHQQEELLRKMVESVSPVAPPKRRSSKP